MTGLTRWLVILLAIASIGTTALIALVVLSRPADQPELRGGTVAVEPETLPVLGRLPAFELVRSTGEPFGREAMAGSPWVVDFIFTTCPGPCPMM
ncbi:MAG: SCO family protein, partial [Phycisphaeraceae bacterium]|nr:SCO family protein [Phycisphaeraceae bacterium]